MREALVEAKRAASGFGEVPIGCVIVRDGRIIARAHNLRETWADGTAHAEIIAIREASRALGGWRLEGCTLYVTLEPCPMCAGATVLSRLDTVVYGAADAKGGAVESKVQLIVPNLWNHHPNVVSGILADECGMILKDFFRNLRGRH